MSSLFANGTPARTAVATPAVNLAGFTDVTPVNTMEVALRKTTAVAAPAGEVVTEKMVEDLGKANSEQMSVITKQMLASVRASDVDKFGDQLNSLITVTKGLDPTKMKGGVLATIKGLFGNVKERMLAEYSTVEQRMDTLVAEMDRTQALQRKRVDDMEVLYADNIRYFVGLQNDEAQGRALLVQMQAQIAAEGAATDTFAAQRQRDLQDRHDRLEKRCDDFKRAQALAQLAAPQIRMMQDNARTLASKFGDLKTTTIPAYRSAFTLYLLQMEQKKAAEMAAGITDATEAAIRLQADLLRQNTTAIAEVKQRSVVSIETLQHVQQQLIGAAEDATKIADAGKKARLEAEPKLKQLETELIQRFAITTN